MSAEPPKTPAAPLPPPVDARLEALRAFGDYVVERTKQAITSYAIEQYEITFKARRDAIADVLMFLRDDPKCDFRQLIDVTAVDYPARPERFEVVYNLLSLRLNHRARIKVDASEETLIPTATRVYSAAGWFEREVWDMYGVMFDGHADLRRILTDYGFEGHPQRKDFPLTGYVELRYDEELKRVAYEPVKLTQDFRRFDFMSPWEGMTNIQLPGDEKAVKPPHGYRDVKGQTK